MKRIYHNFSKWEDYHHGMYAEDSTGREIRVRLAVTILSNPGMCRRAMNMAVEHWRFAAEYNLSNENVNRRAWLGQAACSLYAGVHEDETREAWGLMKPEQRAKANEIATEIIKEWLRAKENAHGTTLD